MELTPVSSSQVSAIGHDPATNVLRVQFKSGGTYDYQGVPAHVAQTVMGASSVGSALNEHIKKGGYAHSKV